MTAIKAGNVWLEQELFSGKPNFKRLMNQKLSSLTAEEQTFADKVIQVDAFPVKGR